MLLDACLLLRDFVFKETGLNNPFGLSLTKPFYLQEWYFDRSTSSRLNANGFIQCFLN